MKKKKPVPPKIRRTWPINPKTRVKPSEKLYDRAKEKKKAKSKPINWFGA